MPGPLPLPACHEEEAQRAYQQQPNTPHDINMNQDHSPPPPNPEHMQIDPETLLPKLPSPSELRPFPTTLAIEVCRTSRGVLPPPSHAQTLTAPVASHCATVQGPYGARPQCVC